VRVNSLAVVISILGLFWSRRAEHAAAPTEILLSFDDCQDAEASRARKASAAAYRKLCPIGPSMCAAERL